jgi:hypothetical protein
VLIEKIHQAQAQIMVTVPDKYGTALAVPARRFKQRL